MDELIRAFAAQLDRKYSPAQPRDYHGRWTEGIGFNPEGAVDASRKIGSIDERQAIEQKLTDEFHSSAQPDYDKATVAYELGWRLAYDEDVMQAGYALDHASDLMSPEQYKRAWDCKDTIYDDSTRTHVVIDEQGVSHTRLTPAILPPDIRNEVYASLSGRDWDIDKYMTVGQAMSVHACGEMVHVWAESSGDSHPNSIAMQLAAKAEFGYGKTDHLDQGLLNTGYMQQIQPGLQKFVRTQYNMTQAKLTEMGMDSVPLYRGMHFDSDKSPYAPGWDVQPISQQPLSSWTYSAPTAVEFGEATGEFWGKTGSTTVVGLAAVVPKERILSTTLTGFGCKDEAEMVVLAGKKDTAQVITWTPDYEPDAMQLADTLVR